MRNLALAARGVGSLMFICVLGEGVLECLGEVLGFGD